MKKTNLTLVFCLLVLISSCAGGNFNFTCNDYANSQLSLEEKVKNLKKCNDGDMFQWRKSF